MIHRRLGNINEMQPVATRGQKHHTDAPACAASSHVYIFTSIACVDLIRSFFCECKQLKQFVVALKNFIFDHFFSLMSLPPTRIFNKFFKKNIYFLQLQLGFSSHSEPNANRSAIFPHFYALACSFDPPPQAAIG